jgi:hypothetical protein
VNQADKALNTPWLLVVKSGNYNLANCNMQKIKAAWQAWFKMADKREIQSRKELMEPAEFDQEIRDWKNRCDQGYHRLGGPACSGLFRDIFGNDGAAQLLLLMMREHHPEVTIELVRDILTNEFEAVKEALEDMQDMGKSASPTERERPVTTPTA